MASAGRPRQRPHQFAVTHPHSFDHLSICVPLLNASVTPPACNRLAVRRKCQCQYDPSIPFPWFPNNKSCVKVPLAHRAVPRTTHDVDVVVQEDKTPNTVRVSLKFVLWSRSFGLRWG